MKASREQEMTPREREQELESILEDLLCSIDRAVVTAKARIIVDIQRKYAKKEQE